MRPLWLLVGLALGGCADNAFLELALTLPAGGACDVRAAALEGRFLEDGEPGCPVGVDWTTEREPFSVDDAPVSHTIDVEAVGADAERDLCLRVRFCAQAECVGHDVVVEPSTTVQLERPFVRGRRTAYALAVDDPCAVQRALPTVPRCDVAGACD